MLDVVLVQAPAKAKATDGEAAGGAADASSGNGDGNDGAEAARACHVCSRIYDPQQQAFVRQHRHLSLSLRSLQPFWNPTRKVKVTAVDRAARLKGLFLLWSGFDGCV